MICCNKHQCKKNWACYHYVNRIGENNRAYLQINDMNKCCHYKPARCEVCQGKGYHTDYCKIQKKYIKTNCIICGGSSELNYSKMKGKK